MLTTDFVPGSPVWVDLGTPDVEAAAAFYSGLFGWTHRAAGPDAGGYGFLLLGDRTAAAIGPLPEESAETAWTVYFQTPDADRTTKAVEQAGGRVRTAPADVFTAGRMAGLTDPAGAPFAVWQPGETTGLSVVTVPGSLCWTELHTDDLAGSRSFYRTVFDWTTHDEEMPGGGSYTVIRPAGGGEESAQGGMADSTQVLRASGAAPHWLPYFEVADVDAVVDRARRGGGAVAMPPQTVDGVGRLAALTDPFGARFSVISGEPEG